MKIHNPTIFCLVLLLTILNIIDYVMSIPYKYAESNLIYLLTGSMALIILPKLILVVLAWWGYIQNKYPSNFMYYTFILILVVINLLLIFVIITNTMTANDIKENPQLIQEYKNMPNEEKGLIYMKFIVLFYILPMSFCLFVFWLYDRSLKHITIGNITFKDIFKRRNK